MATKPKRTIPRGEIDYTRDIWLRQKGETEKAYNEFVDYRDSEHRRTRDYSNGAYNSSRWAWQERVKAWDDHLVKKDAERLVRYRIDMNERHRAIAKLAQSRAAQWLRSLDDATVARMRASDIVRMLEVATRLERIAAGEGNPEVAISVTADVVEMTSTAADARMDQLIQEVEKRRAELAANTQG